MLRILRLTILLALLVPVVTEAQVYCGPNGVNAYGMACDPYQLQSGGGGTPQQQGFPSSGYPGQGQQVAPPVITNRPPSTIPPLIQPPGGPGAQPGAGVLDPRYGPRDSRDPRDPRDPRFGFQDPRVPPFVPAERNEFQDFVLQSVGRDLPMFGYNLFQNVPSTFAPLDRIPVTPDYVVGPGDEILIRAWGQVDIDYRAVVDRDGAISIPRVGNINVAGIRFQDLQGYLKNAIGRVFRNFDLSVTMGQLRSIHIFVVGHATRPGAYTVSSLSSLVNALFASGGPTAKGSMRSIQLKRGDKLVTEFDVYDLLLKGDKSKDAPLLPGDVIYIPPIGQLAAIAGSINNPAIYEIKGDARLSTLIELAGGLAVTAAGTKVIVERILDRKTRKVDDFQLDKEGLAHPVRNGDVVQVLPLSPRFDNAVTVRGNVAVPARHPWRPGMRIKDVVPDKDALIVPDYWIKRNMIVRPDITGRDPYGMRPALINQQRPGFPTLPDLGTQTRPGDATARKDAAVTEERLRIDVKQTLPEVNWDYAVVERLNLSDLTTALVPFNLGKAILEGDPQNNLVLQPGDVITIFSKGDIQVPIAKQTKFVRLEGEIATPGIYQIMPGETLRQLVARVGGFSPNAYVYGSEFTRESVRVQQQKRLDEALDRLAQEIERNAAAKAQTGIEATDVTQAQAQAESQRRLLARLREVKASGRVVLDISPDRGQLGDLPVLALEDGDRFLVPSRPSTVGVIGAVYNQNTFIFDSGKRVSDYLQQAGGPTREADSSRVYVVRVDGSVTGRAQGSVFTAFTGERLMPGDTIVVPENLDRFRLTKELKDWSQIFYQFALGVAGLKVLKDL